jgi:hypothetical protein
MIHKDTKVPTEIAPGIEEQQVVGLFDVGRLESRAVLVDLLNPAFRRRVVLDVVEVEEQSGRLCCNEESY